MHTLSNFKYKSEKEETLVCKIHWRLFKKNIILFVGSENSGTFIEL